MGLSLMCLCVCHLSFGVKHQMTPASSHTLPPPLLLGETDAQLLGDPGPKCKQSCVAADSRGERRVEGC